MKIFTIISAVPEEHYKHQKGFSVVMETPKRGKQKDQIKVWLPEVQYNLAMFMQKHRILTQYLRKKDAEKFLDLLEEFDQEKYCEGSNDEAMNNSEDI